VLTIALLYAVFSETHLADFKQMLLGVSFTGVCIYFAISVFAYVCRAYRYHLMLSSMSDGRYEVSFFRMFLVTTIRNALVDFLPVRLGEVSYMYVLSRLGVPFVTGASSFGVCLLLDISVLFGLFAILVFVSPFLLDAEQILRWESLGLPQLPLALVCAVAFSILFFLLLRAHKIWFVIIGSKIFRKFSPPKLNELAQTVGKDLEQVATSKNYKMLLLMTVFLRVAKYGSLYVLLASVVAQYGVKPSDLNPVLALAAFVSAEAAASLPISGLMGFGAYEFVWASVFNLPEAVSANEKAIGLVIHLITQICGYSLGAVGIVWFLIFELRNSKAPGNKSE